MSILQTNHRKSHGLSKEDDVKAQAIHAENEQKIEALHNELHEILHELRDSEVLMSTNNQKDDVQVHNNLLAAGKEWKEKREEKANKWATSHEAETKFHTKMVEVSEKMEQHLAKAIELEERRLTLEECYIVCLEKSH